MNTWDVVILRWPFTDGSGAKQRPALLISSDTYHNRGEDGLFLLLTSNISRQAEYDVLVQDTHEEFSRTGLRVSSVIRVDKIMNLHKGMVTRVLGQLGSKLQSSVKEKLRLQFSHLGL